jgi:hypothetical protein
MRAWPKHLIGEFRTCILSMSAGKPVTTTASHALAPQIYQTDRQGGSVPFAHVVARYPVVQQLPSAPTFLDRHEAHPAHIPAHLPAFPDAHTYQRTPAFNGHESDAQRQRQAVLTSKQQAEAALVKLHQRLAATAAGGGAGRGQARGAAINPFLAPPVVMDAAEAGLPEPVADGGAAAAGGDDLSGLDFDAGAARRVFGSVLSPGAERKQQQQQQQQPLMGGATAMDVDGAEAAPDSGAPGSWVLWAPDTPADGAAGAADANPGSALRRQEMLQLQWHDPAKAASVLGASAPQRPPDAYQERVEAAMATEGGGARQRKSAYGRGNADLQRADEMLRSGHGAPAEGGGAGASDDYE